MKGVEIERKFLLRPCSVKRFLRSLKLPYRSSFIAQYYLTPKDEEYVRYRQRDQDFFKTIKRGEGMVRQEHEIPVDKEEFDDNLKNYTGNIIKKRRFVFEYRGVTYEMDSFQDELKGLCYLEIEFDDEESANAFVLPKIFSHLYLAEVTNDKRFNNQSLCSLGSTPTIDTDLEVLIKKVTHSLTLKRHLKKSDGSFVLAPYENSGVAIKSILRGLSIRIEKHRRALIKNPDDSESLHQFRISLRVIRSTLDAFEPLLAPQWYALHRRNLSFLMKQTNVKRDRDVMMTKIPLYRSLLSGKMQKALVPLEDLLLAEKERADKYLCQLAENELLKYEISSLPQPKTVSYICGDPITQPIVITAMQIVQKETDTLVKKVNKINAKSDDEEYHKLRIKYKKRRYFVEIMKSLIKKKRYKEIIKRIKKIQTILGNFNDYHLQELHLRSLEDEPTLQSKKSKKALNLLIKKIERLKSKQKKKFQKKSKKTKGYKRRANRLFEAN